MTGLLHISDRLLAGELSRVEAARGTLYPLRLNCTFKLGINLIFVRTNNECKINVDIGGCFC